MVLGLTAMCDAKILKEDSLKIAIWVNFGEMLMDLEREAPGERKVAWKSNVAEAYQILPMHQHWQLKQVTQIDDNYHVDRCNTFGRCSAGCLFISFNSLAAWIAKEIKKMKQISYKFKASS